MLSFIYQIKVRGLLALQRQKYSIKKLRNFVERGGVSSCTFNSRELSSHRFQNGTVIARDSQKENSKLINIFILYYIVLYILLYIIIYYYYIYYYILYYIYCIYSILTTLLKPITGN